LNTKQPALHSPIILHFFPLQPRSHYFCRWIKASDEVVRVFSALSQRLLSFQSLLAFLLTHADASQVFLSHYPRISVDRAANDRLKAFLAALCTIFAVRTSRVHGSTATVTIQVQFSIRHFGSGILISTSNKNNPERIEGQI
jgi:hypothetical protein